mmetsp:Transcript_33134/g.40087  ORF Transcript_33134/g.40087 Transcript_33134/m.40087 type:complete len:86 (+) Transcript_33134:54-311(+)
MMIIYAVNGFRCEQFVFLFLNQFYETVENEFLLAQCYFLSIAAIKRESSEIFMARNVSLVRRENFSKLKTHACWYNLYSQYIRKD